MQSFISETSSSSKALSVVELIQSDKSLKTTDNNSSHPIQGSIETTNNNDRFEEESKPDQPNNFSQSVVRSANDFTLPPVQKLPPLSSTKVNDTSLKDTSGSVKLDDLVEPLQDVSEDDISLTEKSEKVKSLGANDDVVSSSDDKSITADACRPLDLSKKSSSVPSQSQ